MFEGANQAPAYYYGSCRRTYTVHFPTKVKQRGGLFRRRATWQEWLVNSCVKVPRGNFLMFCFRPIRPSLEIEIQLNANFELVKLIIRETLLPTASEYRDMKPLQRVLFFFVWLVDIKDTGALFRRLAACSSDK